MKPIVLCIMDGVGIRKSMHGNAYKMANKPNLDYLYNNYPHSLLEASGELVGLPSGQMGNSEVGHMNIGAGRIVYQPLQLINEKIKNKEFFENVEFDKVFNHVLDNNSNLHLLGLLSDGGIHSHINHLLALIDNALNKGVKHIYLHMFLDGRDTLPDSAIKYLDILSEKLNDNVKLATLSGRYYAMDRDNRWDRIKLAYDAIVNGVGIKKENYKEAIEDSYKNNELDEFVKPVILDETGMIKENDGLILFNFRPDRGRELFSALTNSEFKGFEREQIKNLKLVTMMPLSNEVIYTPAFKNQELVDTLGEYLADKGKKQLRIAETEKYAHVTFFFNGGEEKQYPGEDRILVPSPKVETYDMQPEMSAREVTEKVVDAINSKKYDCIILNYANPDMVGHTGSLEAAIKAIETVDECLGKVVEAVEKQNGVLLITADHGNAEQMIDYKTGEPHTAHTTNPVPIILITDNKKYKLKENGKLADLAPTMLDLMGIEKPEEMTGESLLVKE